MERIKTIAGKILYPPLAPVVLMAPVCATLMLCAFIFFNGTGPFALAIYIVTGYEVIVGSVRLFPWLVRKSLQVKNENKYIVRLTTDETMKAQVSLGFAVPANLIFGMVQLYSAILNSSFWFYTLSIYYILLAVMRAILLRYAQQYRLGDNIVSESKVYRFSGIMLMVMNLAVTTIVSCIVRLDMGFTHPPVITVFIAMGTFFCVFVTIRNLVRYHDYKTPVMSAAKVISFVAAMMSFLSLETAMLASFGARFSMTFKRGITAVTGGLVCLAVLATSVYMIVRSTKYIRSA